MPGAAAIGRLAPKPISSDARHELAAVAVTRLRRTLSCRAQRPPVGVR